MTLVELQNWSECRTAILEYENDSVYLYSRPHDENLDLKALWIANTKKRIFGKSNIKADFDKGIQPYLPKEYCLESGYISDFKNKENWELQWGLDQNSIAVYFKGVIIAILPEWSGFNGFHGYSIGTNRESEVAWPLNEDNIQIQRFLDERNFLDSWSESKWILRQESLVSFYKNLHSGDARYFAADAGKWPPLGIHYSKSSEIEFISTVGMSQLPMPEFGMKHENVQDFRRIELAIACRPISDFEPLARYLSGQATYPWYFGTHFDHGHTMPCEQLREVGSKASYFVIIEAANFLPKVLMPSFDDGVVRLLHMIPIHASEQRFAEENSTQRLIELIEQAKVDPFDIHRDAIV
ncbi:suppressor of fused domain protein [Undibacterium sp. Di27W]|uniref:suppressor of fused domain protein n=1 Tax=Undibacterium sp. Di27W TaxID=3413036 RepID=UPI003BF34428